MFESMSAVAGFGAASLLVPELLVGPLGLLAPFQADGAAAAAAAAAGDAPLTAEDFSVQSLFLRSHWLVQGVLISLVVASIWSWGVIFEKWMTFGRLRRGMRRFEDTFWSGVALDQLYEEVDASPRSPMERVFVAGMREWRRSFDAGVGMVAGAQERIDRAMNVALSRETETVESRLSHLATIGATTPFIGLFGTVWGIKNSFEAIALSQNTNIAVVAPGIAEALVATAMGLFAAIPATIAYNQFTGGANRLNGRLENFADEFATILSRQLEKRSG
ncbi:MAG: protein TolQ [Pseudomonadota bacterium]